LHTSQPDHLCAKRAQIHISARHGRPVTQSLRIQGQCHDIDADTRPQSASLSTPRARECTQPSDFAGIYRRESAAPLPAHPSADLDDDSPRARRVDVVASDDVEFSAPAVVPVAFQDTQARLFDDQARRVLPRHT
jgi:hypothetical protein